MFDNIDETNWNEKFTRWSPETRRKVLAAAVSRIVAAETNESEKAMSILQLQTALNVDPKLVIDIFASILDSRDAGKEAELEQKAIIAESNFNGLVNATLALRASLIAMGMIGENDRLPETEDEWTKRIVLAMEKNQKIKKEFKIYKKNLKKEKTKKQTTAAMTRAQQALAAAVVIAGLPFALLYMSLAPASVLRDKDKPDENVVRLRLTTAVAGIVSLYLYSGAINLLITDHHAQTAAAHMADLKRVSDQICRSPRQGSEDVAYKSLESDCESNTQDFIQKNREALRQVDDNFLFPFTDIDRGVASDVNWKSARSSLQNYGVTIKTLYGDIDKRQNTVFGIAESIIAGHGRTNYSHVKISVANRDLVNIETVASSGVSTTYSFNFGIRQAMVYPNMSLADIQNLMNGSSITKTYRDNDDEDQEEKIVRPKVDVRPAVVTDCRPISEGNKTRNAAVCGWYDAAHKQITAVDTDAIVALSNPILGTPIDVTIDKISDNDTALLQPNSTPAVNVPDFDWRGTLDPLGIFWRTRALFLHKI